MDIGLTTDYKTSKLVTINELLSNGEQADKIKIHKS